jgi:hypothetical protein
MRFSIGKTLFIINGFKIKTRIAPPIGFISEKQLEEYRVTLNDIWKEVQWCKERRGSTWAFKDIEWKPLLDILKSIKRPLTIKKLQKTYEVAERTYYDKEQDFELSTIVDDTFLDELSNAVLVAMGALDIKMPAEVA